MTRRLWLVALAAAMLMAWTLAPASAETREDTDLLDQGGAEVYSPGGATLVRHRDGLSVGVRMDTPIPGDYVYPEGIEPGDREVFTLWAFVFNHPELCTDPCDADDLTGPAAAAAYGVDGVVARGDKIVLRGFIAVGDDPYAFDDPLQNPAGAEVHLAVAPHGAADRDTLAEQLSTPIGSSACGCWWVAVFK